MQEIANLLECEKQETELLKDTNLPVSEYHLPQNRLSTSTPIKHNSSFFQDPLEVDSSFGEIFAKFPPPLNGVFDLVAAEELTQSNSSEGENSLLYTSCRSSVPKEESLTNNVVDCNEFEDSINCTGYWSASGEFAVLNGRLAQSEDNGESDDGDENCKIEKDRIFILRKLEEENRKIKEDHGKEILYRFLRMRNISQDDSNSSDDSIFFIDFASSDDNDDNDDNDNDDSDSIGDIDSNNDSDTNSTIDTLSTIYSSENDSAYDTDSTIYSYTDPTNYSFDTNSMTYSFDTNSMTYSFDTLSSIYSFDADSAYDTISTNTADALTDTDSTIDTDPTNDPDFTNVTDFTNDNDPINKCSNIKEEFNNDGDDEDESDDNNEA